ncbi:MAG: hypothetical protein HZA80_02455 [Candidatus Taylorbacteria bacterium]|nr:hypothetical protein [Candidatus Taylorbacteria bacterium]
MQENNQSFKVTTNGKAPAPKKWFILLVINAILGGVLFFFAVGVAWDPPAWFRIIHGDVVFEILGFLLSASALVFALAFIIDSLRLIFGRFNK